MQFQHTAARRRLVQYQNRVQWLQYVSTHSRPKAAGRAERLPVLLQQFQHTAARRRLVRLPESRFSHSMFQHTAARRRLEQSKIARQLPCGFQHTAARRRLEKRDEVRRRYVFVSTHSRPKAAGASLKSLAPSGFAAPSSLSSQEKRVREYNTAFSVTPAFAIS